MRRVLPALGLFVLSPLVAEFLLGNISIGMAFAAVVLAPLYGGGALLVREVTRRTGRGWSTILPLALAFGVVEEAFTTQSLFNPDYAGAHLLEQLYIPGLGIGGWWTPFVLTLHTVWSISVPIAIVEACARSRRTTPWLGKVGLTVTAVVFVFGAAIATLGSYNAFPFVASVGQFAGAAVVVVLLVAAAFALGPRLEVATVPDRRAPGPWVVGGCSFVLSSLFLGPSLLRVVVSPWLIVALYAVVYVLSLLLFRFWSASPAWSDGHRLALAGGALLTYAWHGFPQSPSLGGPGVVDTVGNAVFAAAAVALLVVAALRLRTPRTE